jgi:hypothetical protein
MFEAVNSMNSNSVHTQFCVLIIMALRDRYHFCRVAHYQSWTKTASTFWVDGRVA